jgi:hypothetical protein
MTKKTKITAEQIESSLANFCTELKKSLVKLDTVPPGWFTVKDRQVYRKIMEGFPWIGNLKIKLSFFCGRKSL